MFRNGSVNLYTIVLLLEINNSWLINHVNCLLEHNDPAEFIFAVIWGCRIKAYIIVNCNLKLISSTYLLATAKETPKYGTFTLI